MMAPTNKKKVKLVYTNKLETIVKTFLSPELSSFPNLCEADSEDFLYVSGKKSTRETQILSHPKSYL